jgi:hypothetical protein
MSVSLGYEQLQPKYILGTDLWPAAAAESLVGSDVNPPNQLRDHLPFYALARSPSVVAPRVSQLGTAGFIGNSIVQPDDSTTALVDPPEEFEITSIVGDVALTTFPIEVESYGLDQLQLQIEFKKIALHVTFWNQFFRPLEPAGFRGLPDLVDPSQVITAGGALSLEDLDLLVAKVTEGDAEMSSRVLVMNSATFVQFVRARRALGLGLEYATRGERRYAVHNGAVILVSDFVPGDRALAEAGPGLTSVWCFTVGFEDNGVFGLVPPDVGDDGLVIEKVQGGAGADTLIYRLRWHVAVGLGAMRGLACLDGVRGAP